MSVASCIALSFATGGASAQNENPAAAVQQVNIEAGPLGDTINSIIRIFDVNVLAAEGLIEGTRAPAISGPLSAEDALERALAGSGFSIQRLAGGDLVIVEQTAQAEPQRATRAGEPLVEPEAPMVADTIIVFGRKRPEQLFEMPVSVSVLGGDALDRGSVDPGPDLARRTPNYNFVDFAIPGNSFGGIRGIGPLGVPLNSLDNTVGYSTNEVPTSVFGFSPNLFDVEQVEVFRGPQGTLFGRNALGGLINVVTKPADGTRELNIGGELGDNGTRSLDVAAGAWLLPEVLAARGAVRFQSFDGDIPNPIIGGNDGDADVAAGRLTLGFMPNGPLSASLIVGHEVDKRNNPFLLLIEQPDFPTSGVDIEQQGDRFIDHITLNIEREFDGFTFTSLTGFQDIDTEARADDTDSFLEAAKPQNIGRPPSEFIDPDQDLSIQFEGESIFSHEFRLNSNPGNFIDWVIGVSYFRSTFYQDRTQTSSSVPVLNGVYNTDTVSETYAVFGDFSVPITDQLTLSGGLRVAHDEQDFESNYTSNGFPGTVPFYRQVSEFEDTYITGRAAASWRWNEDLISYVSIANGYASGGYERYTVNAYLGLDTPPFRPSESWTYEVGSKAFLFDDRLSISGALFFNDVDDGQLFDFNFNNFSLFFGNLDYESYGGEIELAADLSRYVSVRGGLGVTQTEIGFVDPQSFAALSGTEEGNEVPLIPNVTANLGLDVQYPLQEFGLPGEFIGMAEISHVGSREADTANSYEIDSYEIANLRAGIRLNSGLEVFGFARNVADERPIYFASNFGPNARSAVPGRGRQIGVGARWTYGW